MALMDALSQSKEFLICGHRRYQETASGLGVVGDRRSAGGIGNLVEHRYDTGGGHDAEPSIRRS